MDPLPSLPDHRGANGVGAIASLPPGFMRFELVENRDQTRKRGESVLEFRVHAEPGEKFTPATRALAQAAAHSAALAWDAVNVYTWRGPVQ